VTDLQRDLDGVRAAHQRLAERLAGLTDARARQPSLLPGWTVGHVLAHVARNAQGMQGMVEAAANGGVAPMYPGGLQQREADIEQGAGRRAVELVADVVATSAALESACAALSAQQWEHGSGITVFGPIPIADVPSRRWREAVVHHTDLGLGGDWADWPADFVEMELGRLPAQWASRHTPGATTLPAQALAVSDHHRVAWLLGRAEIEGLAPAGVI
jgi:maleylpyruvate isomerase